VRAHARLVILSRPAEARKTLPRFKLPEAKDGEASRQLAADAQIQISQGMMLDQLWHVEAEPKKTSGRIHPLRSAPHPQGKRIEKKNFSRPCTSLSHHTANTP
jgi:hypothetical protein